MCNLAYAKSFKHTRLGFDANGQRIIKNQQGKVMIRVLWSESRSEVIVVIKGSHSLFDWLLNFLAWPASCRQLNLPYRIHYGFYRLMTQLSYDSPPPQSLNVLQELESILVPLIQRGKHISITGHSSGGAIGTVLGDYLSRKYPKCIKRIVTFGQPAIGNWQFHQRYLLKSRTYRICCDLDIVTFMPPLPLVYWHVGSMLWLYNGRIYENTPTMVRLGRSLLSWLIRPFSYHLMSKYIRNKDFFDEH
nr:lipase [Vibrio agarilyticus]